MLRVSGLVRTFNQVRAVLNDGLAPEDVETFVSWVKTMVAEVEEVCAASLLTPRHLPGPSRRAYEYLKNLDLSNLPMRAPGIESNAPRYVKLKNVVKLGEQVSERIWRFHAAARAGGVERRKMEEDLARYAGQIEELCTAGGATPAALDPPSRRTYCWLKFLTAPENLTAHLNALALGREVASAWRLRPGQQLSLHLINMHSLWRARQSSDQLLVRVTEGFINADRAVWQAIMKQILAGSCAESRQMVDEFTETEQFTDVSYEIDALAAPPSLPTKGRVHDLAESFERVNGQYFGGRLARPKLTWNQTLTVRKFGHYQPSRDTIMISASLDSDRVPAFALDFVMYHEMLHKWHGIMYLNGRRVAHSGAFREDERRYPRWQEAERVLAAIHSGQ